MKKFLVCFLSLCILMLSMTACSGSESQDSANPFQTTGSRDSTDGATQEADATAANIDGVDVSSGNIDVDLTKLSSTMVYSEVYNIVNTPESYMGKTIKMKGLYNASYYEGTGNYYHYVLIKDATACCQQGLEFVWKGDHAYPADYPENGTEVEIVGVFGQYEELGVTYNYIETDNITLV